MSSMRIVLVDPLGDVLFSGESLIGRRGEPAANMANVAAPSESAESRSEAETGRCPETMRSAGSGVYRSVDPATVKSLPVIEDVSAQIRHAESLKASKKNDERAA
jgi:hypothetical protein